MKPAKPSPDNRSIAAHYTSAFGVRTRIYKQLDDRNRLIVDMFEAGNTPTHGVTSFGTIGLSDHPLETDRGKAQFGLEIVGACESYVADFANMLSTAALCIIKDRWPCFPYATFPDVVDMYRVSKTMRHLFFTDAFLWDDPFSSQVLTQKTVAWLQAVPISESELRVCEREGGEALHALLKSKKVNVCNIDRNSVA
jgi:antitoxin YqcF